MHIVVARLSEIKTIARFVLYAYYHRRTIIIVINNNILHSNIALLLQLCTHYTPDVRTEIF